MPRFLKTEYKPLYPQKYVGKYPIMLKSSWELEFARRDCDLNSSCLQWAYEPLNIPYRDPTSGRQKVYVPDFLISFKTPSNGIKVMLVEIKPLHEAVHGYARSKGDAAIQAQNLAKWQAAAAWCARRGITFKFLTEDQIFSGTKTPPKRKIKPYGKKK